MNTPVYGCDGCRGTLGSAGCPVHSELITKAGHVHDFQWQATLTGDIYSPGPHEVVTCATCGETRYVPRQVGAIT